MNIIKKEYLALSYNTTASCILEDNIEGDMTFVFALVRRKGDNKSYTRYAAKNPHEVYIEISNVNKGKGVRLDEPIEVGTYQKDNRLFLSFVISKDNENGDRIISVTFFAEKK